MTGNRQAGQIWSQQDYEHIGEWENWLNLRDMVNALRYGFAQYRLPKVGQAINVKEATDRVERLEAGWSSESRSRADYPGQPPPKFNSLPITAKCYLHSILTRSDQSPYPPIDDYSYYAE